MTSIVALGAITGGINLTVSQAELQEFGLMPGSFSILSVDQIERIRLALRESRGLLPNPNSGGSVANTADFIARAGISCGLMGVGGDDSFGRSFVSNCEKASLKFLSALEDGSVTGYDFYLESEDGVRTIIFTHGANSLLSPKRIEIEAIQDSKLLLLDGYVLDFGPDSEAAISYCIESAEELGIPFVLTLASTRIIDGYRDFYDAYASKAQMVVGNIGQAAVLLGLKPEASLEEVRIELANTSIDAVITLDADGVFARFGEEEFLLPTQKIDVVDSTGAGDNFLGGFFVAKMRGFSVHKALAIGNFVAGEIVQYQSARLPMSYDVPKLIEKAIQLAEEY